MFHLVTPDWEPALTEFNFCDTLSRPDGIKAGQPEVTDPVLLIFFVLTVSFCSVLRIFRSRRC